MPDYNPYRDLPICYVPLYDGYSVKAVSDETSPVCSFLEYADYLDFFSGLLCEHISAECWGYSGLVCPGAWRPTMLSDAACTDTAWLSLEES